MAGQYTTRGSDCLSESLQRRFQFDRRRSASVNPGGQQANINIAGSESRPEKAQKNTEFSIDSQYEGA